MAKNNVANEIPLLRRALRIAAVESYISEVISAQMYDHITNEGEIIRRSADVPNKEIWVQERIDMWIEEAEKLI